MTSATDELRRLLDERGVEWWQSANTLGCVFTRWQSPLFGDEVCAMENGEEGLVVFDHYLTPAQAIDATLGRGTCRDVGKGWMWRCSECKCRLDIDRDDLPTMWVDNVASVPRYCPNCGRKVKED